MIVDICGCDCVTNIHNTEYIGPWQRRVKKIQICETSFKNDPLTVEALLSSNLMLIIIMLLRIWRQTSSFWHRLFVQFECRAAIFSVWKIEPVTAPSRYRAGAVSTTVSCCTARGYIVIVLTPAVVDRRWGLFTGWAVAPVSVYVAVVGGVVVPVKGWTLPGIVVIGSAVGGWRGWAVVWSVTKRAGIEKLKLKINPGSFAVGMQCWTMFYHCKKKFFISSPYFDVYFFLYKLMARVEIGQH